MMKNEFVSPISAFWLYFISVFVFMGAAFLSGKFLGKTGLFAAELGLILPLIIYYLIQKKSIPAGFSMHRTSGRFYIIGLMSAAGFFVIADELNRILNMMKTMDTDLFTGIHELMLWDSPSEMVLLIFGGVVCAAFAEEMVLRGFLQGHLQRSFPPAKAILAVSFCFAFLHFQPWFMFQHFLFSLLMGFLFLKAQSVWPVISAHAVFNLCVLLMNNMNTNAFSWYNTQDHVAPLVLLSALLLLFSGLKWLLGSKSRPDET